MQKTDKIVIVGGGSSGWMSAATLVSFFPDKEITVVESPDYPTVGVGESTLGHINDWLNAVGLREEDFLYYVDGSYKLSIKFTDFYKENSGSFHYPFGQPCFEDSPLGLNSWFLKKALYPDLPVHDYVRTFYPAMTLVDQNKYSENRSGRLKNFDPRTDVAYHFDATKFGIYLKEKFCLPRGVKLVEDTVVNVNIDESGISSLDLLSGGRIEADLYIDCTGWKSLLLGESLKEPFDSFEDILPNNRAWAARVPYVDKRIELEPFTNCTALDHGWAWNIPLWSRLGCGYVYSDKYVTPESALEEFKNYLMSDKMRVQNEERVQELEFRDLRFRVGIHKRTWVSNVVAIGLSAGFIEPLESNGLFTVHEFLLKLAKSLRRGEVSQWDRDVYNHATRGIFENFAEFVALHYALSRRTSSQYWIDISNKTFDERLPGLIPSVTSTFYDLAQRKMFTQRYDPESGLHAIATGMHYFPIDPVSVETWEFHARDSHSALNDFFVRNRETLQKTWEEEADNSPLLHDYLYKNYYFRDREDKIKDETL